MICIKLVDYDLYKFDKDNMEHVLIAKELMKDVQVRKQKFNLKYYLGLEATDEFWGNNYLVGLEDEIIGFVRVFDLEKLDNSIDLGYAIRRDYRGVGHARKVLRYLTVKLLKDYEEIQLLRLVIKQSNVRSIRVAIDAGFIKEDEIIYTKGK